MNRVSLVGRITAKPELRYTNSQIPFTRFTLAVNRTFSNAQGQKEADFIGIIVWRKPAENICNYLDKGSLISVDGRIQTGSYDDKEGNKRYTFDVVSDNVQFLESKAQAQARVTSYNNNPSNNFGNSPYDYQDNNNQGFNLGNGDDAYSNMGDIVTLNDTDEDID
ncbi:MAG: single-stranded DNA-binding protein [Bacilli bacterium]|nr:single-stranded DNA-binding protein [Bacilli bacterium]MDD4282361.1 single-stranded DNA-binding protein [Bacilli bacterium]MDD4718264.1 single-stranded DNA-binding protein [Bacilli bacterium]